MPEARDTLLGAQADETGCSFLAWAPRARTLSVRLEGGAEVCPMERDDRGYFRGRVGRARPGSRYHLVLDGERSRPDPASRFQPDGVHGPSQVFESGFDWSDGAWRGIPLERFVLYELHVGAFTKAGTFDGVVEHLGYLRDLGVSAIELMPVAQFPGERNWGYDGVLPFAAQNSYGGPEGLKRLVDAAHGRGIAVVLDVVYNHLGPEGNYLGEFGPYFTDRYRTPWGEALNFDGPESDEVRRYFIENALYWVTDCHIDALRLDAVHAIADSSPRTFVGELIAAVHARATELNRSIHVICESAANDARLLRATELGGLGADAQWNDDFHHALRTLVTPERGGYYRDYGELSQLARAYAAGFVYQGQYSAFHRRRHGTPSGGVPASRFVVFSQNHDQVGNRALGERLPALASFEAVKLAAAAVLLSPFVPLLFMGEEYAEEAPFLYFVSHNDEALIEAVRKGRAAEFGGVGWAGEAPDPQDPATFERSRLRRELMERPAHSTMLRYYRELLRLRREVPGLGCDGSLPHVDHDDKERTVLVRRGEGLAETALALHFGRAPARVTLRVPAGTWRVLLDSSHGRWDGPGGLLPELLVSDGHAEVEMGGCSAAALVRTTPEGA
jgi:maltooligosyltrehalose trehalohydrolase